MDNFASFFGLITRLERDTYFAAFVASSEIEHKINEISISRVLVTIN